MTDRKALELAIISSIQKMMGVIKISSKIIFAGFLFFISFQKASAQNIKPHYIIKNASGGLEVQKYNDLLKDFVFDQYRFYDKRRTIKFTNSDVTVELFSAKELLEIYQKQISPFTIMDTIAKKEIAFYLYGGKIQIVTPNEIR